MTNVTGIAIELLKIKPWRVLSSGGAMVLFLEVISVMKGNRGM